MSKSSERGLAFERLVRKITSRKLRLDIKRDKQSGAGIHKQDVRDRFDELPIFIECKDHATIKPKEWWRDADAKSGYGQAPVVVFPDNEEVLCVMRYSDVLELIKEARDWRETADNLRKPPEVTVHPSKLSKATKKSLDNVASAILNDIDSRAPRLCRDGHITDSFGYCMHKGCRYARGYKAPKVKAK